MTITQTELENIERLLDSSDKANIELGLTILSGFTFDENGIKWLIDYYQNLEKIASKNQNRRNLQAILLGTISSEPTKASRVLTLLLKQTSLTTQKQILKNLFIKNNHLQLPRLEFFHLPKVIFEFPNLEKITWQYGNLQTISANILQLPKLNFLDFRHQPLENIDSKIIEHKNLKEIWIGNALIINEDLADSAEFDFFIEAAY